MPNETFKNIFKYIYQHIVLLIGIVSFLKGFLGFFMEKMEVIYILFHSVFSSRRILYCLLFIWFSFKTIQLQCFNNSNWIWIFTYLAIILLIRIFLCILYSTIITCLWTIYSGKQLGIYYIFIYSYTYWITH